MEYFLVNKQFNYQSFHINEHSEIE